MNTKELYIGIMSGTSLDAIDAVLVEFTDQEPRLHGQLKSLFDIELKAKLRSLMEPGFNEIDILGELDIVLGHAYADSCLQLLANAKIKPQQVRAIGNHGQTIRHRPNRTHPFSLQIGDPNIIADKTGITTVADFRRRDLANGGQGAPLAPGFHEAMFRSQRHNRVVLNIGGIANLTILPADAKQDCLGFDTGPGNTLLDAWINKHLRVQYDNLGQFGASGKVIQSLLSKMLEDPYFSRPAPKSTGLEYFNLNWLEHALEKAEVTDAKPEDVQATLQQLTVMTIAQALKQYAPNQGELLVCGGGAYNARLMELLYGHIENYQITSTQEFGIDPDLVEAMAFAWLAKRTLDHLPGNLPAVTGASQPTILGGIYTSNLWQATTADCQANTNNSATSTTESSDEH